MEGKSPQCYSISGHYEKTESEAEQAAAAVLPLGLRRGRGAGGYQGEVGGRLRPPPQLDQLPPPLQKLEFYTNLTQLSGVAIRARQAP